MVGQQPAQEANNNEGLEQKHDLSEKDDDEKQVIYVKQTIESYRDSQHSIKVDEKELNYEIPIDKIHDKNSQKGPNMQSFRPAGENLNESPQKPVDVFEEDIDTESKKSEAISALKEGELDQANRSVAISAMREDDLESRRSVAISVMKDEDTRSKKSVAISVQDPMRINTAKSSMRVPNSRDDTRSKKSVALSANPDRVPIHGMSKKSIA